MSFICFWASFNVLTGFQKSQRLATGSNQTNHEIRRRCAHDQCRSSRSLRQGVRDIRLRFVDKSLGRSRAQEKKDPHEGGH